MEISSRSSGGKSKNEIVVRRDKAHMPLLTLKESWRSSSVSDEAVSVFCRVNDPKLKK